MDNEKKLTSEEGLAIIQSMINTAKHKFSDNGHLYLTWGWVILLCSVTHFILLTYFPVPHSYSVWFLTWIAGIYTMIYSYRHKKKRLVKTYTDDILSYVWLVFIILMFLFGFIFGNLMGKDYYKYVNPGFLALYGMPTFLSGIILRFKPLITGAICCWILSVLTPFMPYNFHLLVLGLGVIAAWIIPGYIMQSRFKKQSAGNGK
jgi:hypothetical protein